MNTSLHVTEAEEDTVVPAAGSCPSLAGCSLMCVNGYVRQQDGCYVCQCVEPDHGQFRHLDEARSY